MKDFAKSVRTGNVTIDPKDDTLRKLEDELRGWLKTYDSKDPNVDKANVEKNIREIRAEIEKYKRKHNIWNTNAGNSKVGNYLWMPERAVEDIKKAVEKAKTKEEMKRAFESIRITEKQLNEDAKEHYSEYQLCTKLANELNSLKYKAEVQLEKLS